MLPVISCPVLTKFEAINMRVTYFSVSFSFYLFVSWLFITMLSHSEYNGRPVWQWTVRDVESSSSGIIWGVEWGCCECDRM